MGWQSTLERPTSYVYTVHREIYNTGCINIKILWRPNFFFRVGFLRQVPRSSTSVFQAISPLEEWRGKNTVVEGPKPNRPGIFQQVDWILRLNLLADIHDIHRVGNPKTFPPKKNNSIFCEDFDKLGCQHGAVHYYDSLWIANVRGKVQQSWLCLFKVHSSHLPSKLMEPFRSCQEFQCG